MGVRLSSVSVGRAGVSRAPLQLVMCGGRVRAATSYASTQLAGGVPSGRGGVLLPTLLDEDNGRQKNLDYRGTT